MPIAGTHIRFALDLKEKYQVTDLQKYLCGTVYPDTLHTTKINRMLTHPEDFEQWNIAELSDFYKGWHAHLVCDKLQQALSKRIIPYNPEIENIQNNEIWIKRTAIKILLDINDVKNFDVTSYAPLLCDTENPNHEDSDQIIEYYNIFQKMYADPKLLTIDACHNMWLEFGMPEETNSRVRAQSLAYAEDAEMMKRIGEMYERMVRMATDDRLRSTGR